MGRGMISDLSVAESGAAGNGADMKGSEVVEGRWIDDIYELRMGLYD